MKKLLKICLLLIFVLLVFGITTSQAALTVTQETSASDMIKEISKGGYLTGISNSVRKANPHLYCREHNVHISGQTKYYKDGAGITFPSGDSTNGYAKAYILAADGYGDNTSNGMRQFAWWQILGQESGKNELLTIAEGYQTYKKNERTVTVNSNNASANISGNTLVYGPIKVVYSYASVKSGSYSDEWGGFDYAFFDGNTAIKNGVTLCTFKNGTYTPIVNSGTSGDYTKVRTSDYNNVGIYIIADLSKTTDIKSINLKIKENKVNYSATVYNVQGNYTATTTETVYCTNCEREFDEAHRLTPDFSDSRELEFIQDDIYYVTSYKTYNINKYFQYIGVLVKRFENEKSMWNQVSFQGQYDTINVDVHEAARYEKNQDGTYSGSRDIYRFVEFNGCGCKTQVEKGTEYHSQNLFIVDGINKTSSDDVILDIDIPLSTSINIIKVWEDFDNQYIKRPDNISIVVERKTANTTWETLRNGQDYNLTAWNKTQDNKWTATINNLLRTNENGEIYEYKVTEVPLNYYKTTYSPATITANTENAQITITNTLNYIEIDITKIWDDINNKYQTRPENISIVVQRRIENSTTWETLNSDDYNLTTWNKSQNNKWTATIKNLLKTNQNGQTYEYKVTEVPLNYYKTTYSPATITANTENAQITITNTLKHVDIDITKKWNDYNNAYDLRDTIDFNVYRSIDNKNWTKLTKDTHYKLNWKTTNGNTWQATISQLLGVDSSGKEYYFKVEERPLDDYLPEYPAGQIVLYRESQTSYSIDIDNSLKHIDISGYVWLDGQTGIKPAVANNGKMDASETKMAGITVYLYYKNPETGVVSKIKETKTNSDGFYKFTDNEIGYYYVKFEYDGIHFEDTKQVVGGDSKAFETEGNRNTFNGRFQTITHGNSNDGTTLTYDYDNNKSILITTESDGTVKQEFIMNASTQQQLYKTDTENINFGLIRRGTDIALSTDVSNAEVNINGQKTNYTFNSAENTIEIGNGQTKDNVSYNLNLYASDYYYRIRNYVSNDTFKENNYINDEIPEGTTTGEELKVYVTYELNLQNQSTETTRINEVKYIFDEKYTFKQIVGNSYGTTVSGNTITINLNGLSLDEGETETLYLLFEVNNNEGLTLGNFSNKAEITSYSTDKGLIDVDSQPGNFVNSNQIEDDNDTAGGLTIKTEDTFVRKITGKVFDEENTNVNDVIVQLIELKTVNGKVYEYIWQETVSGTGKGLRLNAAGTALEEYTYTKSDGTYEFIGVIPGDYIVRFIYGDGTTYDMSGNVIKYNGQDYKSAKDSNYNSEWYNSSSYTDGASVARDNEARRLETMAYSVNIDASKGVLLKLLNNVTVEDLNETEKEVLISTYNNLYDPDITEVTTEVINKLLKEQVLKNTWMCAETSKIKVAVDTEDINNTNTTTTVNGINRTYVEEIPNINLGLELRPATQIELKKYITGFKLTAANGQTLVNASIDVDEYINGTADANKVQGIKDNVTILDTVWQYEVAPTDINTIVDGASLEFEYTLVVKNTGETDYLGAELADAYENSSTADYVALLTSKANEMKGYMKAGTYRTQTGKYIGNSYYTGIAGTNKVLTEITNIRDYVNNDLKFISSGGDVAIDETAPHTHRILRDDYTMQQATINTILKTTETTGKMENNGEAVIYKVTLGKNPISSTGNLNFENYIAEVMSYTNAAGRRAITSTPGNAEIIDHEHRTGKTHEIDEADTARIQIGAATGEDERTNYIIITAVIAGIIIISAGAVVVKKYVIK